MLVVVVLGALLVSCEKEADILDDCVKVTFNGGMYICYVNEIVGNDGEGIILYNDMAADGEVVYYLPKDNKTYQIIMMSKESGTHSVVLEDETGVIGVEKNYEGCTNINFFFTYDLGQ